MSKSIFKSKTFWVNTLIAGAELLVGLPGDATAKTLAITAVNLVMRKITTEPVHIVPPEK